MSFLLDVDSRLQLRVNISLVINRMHIDFCDGGRTVQGSRTVTYTFTT